MSDSGTITEEAAILGFDGLNLRETHERHEGMEETSVLMVGIGTERILQGIEILEGRDRLMDKKRPVLDYDVVNVSEKVINSVIKSLDLIKVQKIILDPVMVAKGGAKLIDDKAVLLLKKKLMKKVSLITPNIPEAEILTGVHIKTKEDMILAANKLIKFGAKNIFIKGGHLKSKFVEDIFVSKKELKIIKNKRISTSNTHGTGCTLSSAIATFFSCGKSLKKSCELATKYVNNSIKDNLDYGKGHGPINHLSSIKIKKLI